MKRALTAFTISLAISAMLAAAPRADQSGALSGYTQTLQSEVLISSLATADLTREVTAESGQIEHKSEVARGTPVAAVVRAMACQKDSAGTCKINADVIVYRPDGSIFHEVKKLNLPRGRGAVPLRINAEAPGGVYRVVVTVRDLASRRFAHLERQFGVK
jgi:hypothetical protein